MVAQASPSTGPNSGTSMEMRTHEAALRRYFARRIDSAAEVDDMVQECFARLLAARPADPLQSPMAYLFRIASNLLADRGRGHSRNPLVPLSEDDIPTIAPSQEDARRHADLQQAYAKALDELPPRCRRVFIMRRHEELTTPAIAEIMGITHRMVQKHLAHAMAHLHLRLRHFVTDNEE